MRSLPAFGKASAEEDTHVEPHTALHRPGQERTVSPKRAGQRGNAILEGALIFLPMMAFFLGIVDVSFAIFIQSTLTSSTRDASRFAVTYSSSYNGNSCASSQATCITSVVQNDAVGIPSGLNASYITVNYYTANDLTHPVEACNNGACSTAVCTVATCALPQTLSNGTIVSYANQPGNIVQVVIAGYPWNWLVPMNGFSAGTGVTLGAISVDVLGGLPVGLTVPPNP
jgi:Flp pilus assembly protein TadG